MVICTRLSPLDHHLSVLMVLLLFQDDDYETDESEDDDDEEDGDDEDDVIDVDIDEVGTEQEVDEK